MELLAQGWRVLGLSRRGWSAQAVAEHPGLTEIGLDLSDTAALVAWLAPRVSGVDAKLRAERMDGGQSNPSWLLHGAGQSWVLRAKPAPAAELLPSAHAIEREYRILQALARTDVPVPRVRNCGWRRSAVVRPHGARKPCASPAWAGPSRALASKCGTWAT